MAENPFGQGGPEEEELPIEGNPIDTAEVPPALADAIASGEMTELEDGSVEVGEFVEEGLAPEQIPFDANLAEYVEEGVLGPISSDLLSAVESDIDAREDWEKIYEKGLNLLGVEEDERSEPFEGASGVTHPVLAESVTQFQAQAYKELLPAGGPVRVNIIGEPNPQSEQQAQRVQDYMNYQICYNMEEYDPELDQLLFYLPLSGSAFKKVYYDETKQRPVARFVPSEDIIVPYSSVDLANAVRLTHRLKMTGNEVRKLQVAGIYRDVPVRPTHVYSDLEETMEKVSGESATMTYEDDELEIYEIHTFLDLEGFEDVGQDGEPTGIKLPYIITIDVGSSNILAIIRNYEEQDPQKTPNQYFVHYKFLPGLGFYGFGLPHIIGNLSRSATSILRQLIDAGTLANLPAGFKARGIRVRDESDPLQPGEFRDIDAPGGDLRASIIPLPFKEPSGTLLQLLGIIVESGKRFASVADMPLAEQNSAPVGSTVAMLERGTKIMSAIHKRLHYAQKIEFNLLANLFRDYTPPSYPYEVSGGDPNIKQSDFDERIDVMPVSDPNIFSTAQRIAIAQTSLQLVQSNPQVHGPAGMYEAYKRMYEALGVRNIEKVLPPPPQPQPQDPAIENAKAIQGQGLQAFPKQDHQAHIEAHLTFMRTPAVMANINIIGLLTSHMYEHVALQARELVEAEFGPKLQELQQQYQGQIPEEAMQQIQVEIENEVAQRIAELSANLSEVLAPAGNEDPLVEIRKQELALQGARLQQDAKEFETTTVLKAQQDQLNNQLAAQRNDISQQTANERTQVARERIDAQEEMAASRIAVELEKLNKERVQEAIDVQRLRDLSQRN